MDLDRTELTRKTARAFGWSVLRSGFEQGFAFVVFLVLARLLAPEDFGLIAIAAAIIELLRLLSWAGIQESIIRAPTLTDQTANSAFWTNVGIGLVLSAGTMLTAEWIAAAFDHPLLAEVMRAMALIVVISAFGAVPTAMLLRNFGHKALALRALLSNLAGGAVGIWIAVAGGGVWALVAQRLVSEIVQTATVWVALRWTPRAQFRLAEVTSIAGFGAGMTVTNITNIMNVRLQEALVGLYMPVATVGFFRIGNRLVDLAVQLSFMPAHQATLPGFARLQSRNAELGKAFLRAMRLSGLFAFPAFLGLAAVAPLLLPLAMGEKWQPSVPILQILCLMVVPLTVEIFLAPVLVAVGRSRGLAAFSLLKIAAGAAFTLAALPFGILAVAAAMVLRAWLTVPLALLLLRKAAGVRPAEVTAAITPSLFAAVGMAGATSALGEALQGAMPAAAAVGLCVAFGAAAYSLLMLTLCRSFVAETVHSLLPLMPVSMREWVRRAVGQ